MGLFTVRTNMGIPRRLREVAGSIPASPSLAKACAAT
jgi:hypothetical protein